MVESQNFPKIPSDIRISVQEPPFDTLPQVHNHRDDNQNLQNQSGMLDPQRSWHIPRPSLLTKSEKSSNKTSSELGSWKHHPDSPSRGSTSSQSSTASTRSAASGTLLLTAANLANLGTIHPPTITRPKEFDSASVASSTHFTVVHGIGRPHHVSKKSWCARNQLTVLVCTMSFLFMVGLLIGVIYMDVRVRNKYN